LRIRNIFSNMCGCVNPFGCQTKWCRLQTQFVMLSLSLSFFYVSQSFSSLTELLHLIVISTSRSHDYLFPWYIHVYYTPTIITMHAFVCELIYWLTCELHNVFQQIFLNLFCSSRKSVLLLWTYLSSILVDGCWLLVPVWKTIEGLRIGNPSSL
jgi:hypothetical protein